MAILSDGREHTHHEFYGFCVLHSRISELRKKGFNIACWRDGENYVYQLLPEFGTVRETQGQGSAATGGNPGSRGPSLTSGGPTPEPPLTGSAHGEGEGSPPAGALGVVPDDSGRQLSVFEAAA